MASRMTCSSSERPINGHVKRTRFIRDVLADFAKVVAQSVIV